MCFQRPMKIEVSESSVATDSNLVSRTYPAFKMAAIEDPDKKEIM